MFLEETQTADQFVGHDCLLSLNASNFATGRARFRRSCQNGQPFGADALHRLKAVFGLCTESVVMWSFSLIGSCTAWLSVALTSAIGSRQVWMRYAGRKSDDLMCEYAMSTYAVTYVRFTSRSKTAKDCHPCTQTYIFFWQQASNSVQKYGLSFCTC